MVLRLIEVVVGKADGDAVVGVLAEREVLDLGTVTLDDGRTATRILLPGDRVESVSDALSERFGKSEGFRLTLMAVEATLPGVEEEEEPEAEAAAADDEEQSRAGRVSREELYTDVEEAARATPIFVVTVMISTLVAAIGLMRDDVAVVIGAMVIAPLLGPNVALSLATALGDVQLGIKALRTNVLGVAVAGALSLLVGFVFGVDPAVPAIASRTHVGLGDVVLALASGCAGVLAFTAAVPSSLIGVMVAVALLPPLATAGLLAGSGDWTLALGALVLVITNVVCLNVAGVVTFLAQRVQPRTWWEAERARRATLIAIALWTFLLLVLVLLIVSVWGGGSLPVPAGVR